MTIEDKLDMLLEQQKKLQEDLEDVKRQLANLSRYFFPLGRGLGVRD